MEAWTTSSYSNKNCIKFYKIFEISHQSRVFNGSGINCHLCGCCPNLLTCSSYIRKTFRKSRFKISGISSSSTTLTSFRCLNMHSRVMSCRLFIGKCKNTRSRCCNAFPNRIGWFLTCSSWPEELSMNIHGCNANVLIGVLVEGWIRKKSLAGSFYLHNIQIVKWNQPLGSTVSSILNCNRSKICPPYVQFHYWFVRM